MSAGMEMDRKILSLVVVGILFMATFIGVMGTNAMRSYGHQSTGGQYVDQPPAPYLPETTQESAPEATPEPSTNPEPTLNSTYVATPDPSPVCGKPWPTKIEWVQTTNNMTVNESYFFRARMSVQNFDGKCEPSEWYYALDVPIQWVFTNENGDQARMVKNTCSIAGISNVTFICPEPGNWTVTVHWAGNDNYLEATESATVQAAYAAEPIAEPVPQPENSSTNETNTTDNSTLLGSTAPLLLP